MYHYSYLIKKNISVLVNDIIEQLDTFLKGRIVFKILFMDKRTGNIIGTL